MFEHANQGAVDVIHPDVPLHQEYTGHLGEFLEESLHRGQPRVVLDMKDVPLVDSAGLELLIEVQENYQQRGGALKLAAPSPLCREIFEATGVARRFEVYADVTSAVGSFVQ